MQLSPFASVLFGKYDQYFEELKNQKEKPITDDDYAPYESEGAKGVEERSPKSIEELKELSDKELLSFLNKWENVHYDPDEWWVDINFEGLAGAFQSIFKEIIALDESRLQFWIRKSGPIGTTYLCQGDSICHSRASKTQTIRQA